MSEPPDTSLYAGQWIAVVRGRIVASGKTAHDTLLNCRAARVKDEPVLRFIPHPSAKTKSKRSGAKTLTRKTTQHTNSNGPR